MKKTTIALLVGMSLGLSACSTAPSNADIARDMANAQKIRDKAYEERTEKQQVQMQRTLSQVPEWAIRAPSPDEEGLYAIGMGGSDNLRLSIRKAFLDAEYGLARATNQMVSGSERSYSKDANSHVEHEEYTGLIDSLVNSVPIVGIETINQETKPVNGLYNTYVLLKLPYKELNRALQSREAKSQDETVKQSYQELYQRLDKVEKKAAQAAATPPMSQPVAKNEPSTGPAKVSGDPTKILQTILPANPPTLGEEVR